MNLKDTIKDQEGTQYQINDQLSMPGSICGKTAKAFRLFKREDTVLKSDLLRTFASYMSLEMKKADMTEKKR